MPSMSDLLPRWPWLTMTTRSLSGRSNHHPASCVPSSAAKLTSSAATPTSKGLKR